MGTGFLFQFCPRCGEALAPERPCPACGYRQYRNPVAVVAGVLLSSEDALPSPGRSIAPGQATHILLVRRSGTHAGAWCIPCGYVDYEEDIRAAAAREMREETGLRVAVEEICAVKSNAHDPENRTVGIWFFVRYLGGAIRAGDDASEAAFAPLRNPPSELAFPTDREVIEALARAGQESGGRSARGAGE